MKKLWPALVVIAFIVIVASVLARASCAKPSVELVSTGVEKTGTNPEVATAVLTAKHTLDTFIFRFQHPKPGDSGFSILGDFPTPKGPEHIWVLVDAFNNGVFAGRLAQEPVAVPDKHKGDAVEVKKENVSDWGYKTADGKTQGGFTLKALQPSQ